MPSFTDNIELGETAMPHRIEWSVALDKATMIRAAMGSFWRSRTFLMLSLFFILPTALLAYVLKNKISDQWAATVFFVWLAVGSVFILVRRKHAVKVKLFLSLCWAIATMLLPYVLMDVFALHWAIAVSIALLIPGSMFVAEQRRGAIKAYQESSAKWSVSSAWMDDEGTGSTQGGSYPWATVDRFVETREFFFVVIEQPSKMIYIEKKNILEEVQEVRTLLAAHAKRARLI